MYRISLFLWHRPNYLYYCHYNSIILLLYYYYTILLTIILLYPVLISVLLVSNPKFDIIHNYVHNIICIVYLYEKKETSY